MHVTRITLLVVAAAVMVAPMGLSAGVVPNAVFNGGFELFIPPQVGNVVEQVPYMNECWGIGHQANYGEETYQHDLLEENDPGSAAERDPAEEASQLFGPDTCYWDDAEGKDYVWLTPGQFSKDDAVHWSNTPGQGPVYGDADGDGDREATILATTASHNLWQAYPSPHEAFTGDFAALEFDVEDGSISPGALVQVSMNPNPLLEPSDRTFEPDCRLNFAGSELLANMDADRHVSMDPVDAEFLSKYAACDYIQDGWSDMDPDEKRQELRKLRIVQISFWGFQNAPFDADCDCAIQIDNVAMSQPATLVEGAAYNAAGL